MSTAVSTTTSQNRSARILLGLLGPADRRPAPESLAGMDDEDWRQLLLMAHRHRLSPALRWRLQSMPDAPIPEDISATLKQGYRKATLISMKRQRDLALTFRVLHDVGIDGTALKGAYLAFNAYPHPALRPMRDLDVLVPAEQAMAAFEALLAADFRRDPTHPGDPRAHIAANKHLPRLIAPGGSRVEVHHRLVEWHNPLAPDADQRQAESLDLAAASGYWDRRITHSVGTTAVHFPDPTDLLLHLCVHAAYDDRFGGGALILLDLDFLLRPVAGGARPDWPRFWQTASGGGWERGCALLLRLQQELFGTPGIEWPHPDPCADLPVGFVDDLAPLLLGDTRLGREGRLSKESGSGSGKLATLGLAARRLFAPPSKLATLFTVPADSWRVWFYYPAYWWWLTGRRLPEYLRARGNLAVIADERGRARLEAWLKGNA